MNEQVKAKWVAALRSGEFQQGKHALRSNEGYCCLGVLCELHRREFGGNWLQRAGGGWFYLDRSSFLPAEVLEWAGLEHSWPKVEIDGDTASLDSHNDGSSGYNTRRKSFEEIAKAIEEQL